MLRCITAFRAGRARVSWGPMRRNFAARVVKTYFQILKAARPTAVDPVNAMNGLRAIMRAAVKPWRSNNHSALAGSGGIRKRRRVIVRKLASTAHGSFCNGMKNYSIANAGSADVRGRRQRHRANTPRRRRAKSFTVFCDETRPRSQGATLTAWELAQQKISHQIIADNAAGHLMQRGEIDMVIVGSDRTPARTGEVANKIGNLHQSRAGGARQQNSVLRGHSAFND